MDYSNDVLEQDLYRFSPEVLNLLLQDRTTGKNIKFACDNYLGYGEDYGPSCEILAKLITGDNTRIIQPRTSKSIEEQTDRTKSMAEVFTPSWIVNEQNNLIDMSWFGRKRIFNVSSEKGWKVWNHPVTFPKNKTWHDYIALNRMEVACGEGPYLVSRYDTVSGDAIPLFERVGLLDRKFRVIKENANEDEWLSCGIIAVQSCYGYDFQGDNVLLCRENILLSVMEYYKDFFGKDLSEDLAQTFANIISWNIFQMNGITLTIPYSEKPKETEQLMLFDDEEQIEITEEMPAKIMDWEKGQAITFESLKKG